MTWSLRSPVTSRPPSDDTTVGMYIETIPVRVRLGDITSVEALLSESQRAVTQALAHSDVPFDELIELASLQRSATARPAGRNHVPAPTTGSF